MGDRDADRAKLLFVLSNDHGELSNAMYLVTGGAFEAVLLMPERLFALNTAGLPGRAFRYGSVQDVIGSVDREAPDIVFLFSGYLYGINNLFDVDAVERLVRELRVRRRRIVTSDPFLGIQAQLDATTFSDRHPRKAWLTGHFARLYGVFKDIPHLYLVGAEDFVGIEGISFFNPHILVQPADVIECRRRLDAWIGINPTRPRWLFVLSVEDYGGQVAAHGRAAFDDLLARTLREAVQVGRQPVLVAPEVCVASLRGRRLSIPGLVCLPFCGYAVFRSLLLEAEYAFYWNIFSNTIPIRVVNRLPVFFFDPGHLAHAVPPLFTRGIQRYYAGCSLPYLDQRAGLSADVLAGLASQQEQALEPARESFRRSPSPQEMVAGILRR